MEYEIEVKVNIPKEECEKFEEYLENKDFDFFRCLSENNAKIKIIKKSK